MNQATVAHRLWSLVATSALCVAVGCTGTMMAGGASRPGPDGGGAGPGGGTLSDINTPFVPEPLGMRRLLAWQYQAAVSDLLGADAALATTPPTDTAINGFDAVGAGQIALGTTDLQLYEASGMAAAKVALANAASRARLVPCTPTGKGDSGCMAAVVQGLAPRAYRRALESSETNAWLSLGLTAASAYGDFYKGAQTVVAGLLQSANFLYLVELGQPEPTTPGTLRLTGPEMANRLAFFLTGAPPDALLAAAGQNGTLGTADGIRTQAARLLKTPQARAAFAHFFDERLHLRDLSTVIKDATLFPNFTPALAQAMRSETLRLLADVIWDSNSDFRTVFTANYTFVNKALAALYGMPSPATDTLTRTPYPAGSGRMGLLSQASLLSAVSHPSATSPTRRGKMVREDIFCSPIAAPPVGVNTTLPPAPPDHPMTTRDRMLLLHQSDPSCAACHKLMDNVGFAFEHFDAIGQYRKTEGTLAIDDSGNVDALTFQGAEGLGKLVASDERMTRCLVRNLFRQGAGHIDAAGEMGPLARVDAVFKNGGYKLQDAIVEVVASDAFRFGRLAEGQPVP